MNVNESKIKLWSSIGPRASIGMNMLDLVQEYKNLMVLTSDVSTSAGWDRFRKKYKENYLDVGIAEQNLIGIAAGLSSEGYNVITTTFAPFQTMRCCEQIKVNLSYMKLKVTMIGLASGLVLGPLGYTHCCIEDLSIMRSLPNITVISPADSFETLKAVEAALQHPTSVYIRITGSNNNPIIYKNDYKFIIGKTVTLMEVDDICMFTTGAISSEALKAAELLKEEKISCKVINVHTIKPLDSNEIFNHIKNKKMIFSLEEHNKIGGLGSAISDIISSQNKSIKLIKFAINDRYDKGGDYQYLKEKNGLTANQILKNIINEFKLVDTTVG